MFLRRTDQILPDGFNRIIGFVGTLRNHPWWDLPRTKFARASKIARVSVVSFDYTMRRGSTRKRCKFERPMS